MVYKYIRGETLTTTTVRDPSIYRLVARTMARFHRLDVSDKRADDGTTKSELWSKMEQFANLIPERYSSPSTDLQLVHKAIHSISYKYYILRAILYYIVTKRLNVKPLFYQSLVSSCVFERKIQEY